MRNLRIAGAMALLFTCSIEAQDVYRVSESITAPRLLEMSKPRYGGWVILEKSGVIGLELDVMPDGTVGTVALVRSSGAELDQVAAEAAKKFRFAPGMKDGQPVAVRIAVELELNSRSRPPMRLVEPKANPN
jgi:TonB family protein